MGGGDWLDQRQEQQQSILDKAYSDVKKMSNKPSSSPKTKMAVSKEYTEFTAVSEIPNPDVFDKAYVLMRTFIPGWLMFLIILAGLIAVFRKPINMGMTNVLGFSLDDLKETVRRRKERDKELSDNEDG